MAGNIHPTAIIEEGATLGCDVSVGAYAYIGGNVVLGDGCRIHHHATVDGHTTLGDGCEVFPQAVLGTPPQDLKYRGERTTLEIGRRNIFREMVTVHPGTANGGGITRIGDNNLLLIGVHVAHDCVIGSRCILANYVQFAGHVHVEDHVNMGGHSAVHHFVTVGRHAFIGGMTRVAADVPPYMVVVAARGTRSEIRMVNGVGLQRNGFSQEDIAALKSAFLALFSRRARLNGTAIRDRVLTLLEERPLNVHVKYLGEFLLRGFEEGRHGRHLEAHRADKVHRNTWTPTAAVRLTVEVVGRGQVEQTRRDNQGNGHEVVELRATAESGWIFAGWNGHLAGSGNPAQVVVDGPKSVTATFAPQL